MKLLQDKFLRSTLFCLFLALIFYLPAQAATDDTDTWKCQLAPCAWLAGQKGTVVTLPGLPPADIDSVCFSLSVCSIILTDYLCAKIPDCFL
jgi:hypothetical protein